MNDTSPEKELFWELFEKGESILLTGRAGTGKTSLIRNLLDSNKHNLIVLAPTGLSAINLRGRTIHSFFKIPLRPILPDDKEGIKKLRLTDVRILKAAKVIVIDEISMVRADLLDAVDQSLRLNLESDEPFAGKQMILVGDMFQLKPVVSGKFEAKAILEEYYPDSVYFFDSYSYKKLRPKIIELKHVYRQDRDTDFLAILDRVRFGLHTIKDLELINSRFNPYHVTNEIAIELCSTNKIADEINHKMIEELNTTEKEFVAIVVDNFDQKFYPTSEKLRVKIGSQIMMIRNSDDYVNGTLGKVIGFEWIRIEKDEDEGIIDLEYIKDYYDKNEEYYESDENWELAITVEVDDGRIIKVLRESWDNIEYTYNSHEKKITSKTIGTFTQYPIKLAWAVTIHKSQGLTFNRMYLNLGWGAFDTGQTYVALSRSRTLKGIILRKKIKNSDIKVDPRIIEFWQENVDPNIIPQFDENDWLF